MKEAKAGRREGYLHGQRLSPFFKDICICRHNPVRSKLNDNPADRLYEDGLRFCPAKTKSYHLLCSVRQRQGSRNHGPDFGEGDETLTRSPDSVRHTDASDDFDVQTVLAFRLIGTGELRTGCAPLLKSHHSHATNTNFKAEEKLTSLIDVISSVSHIKLKEHHLKQNSQASTLWIIRTSEGTRARGDWQSPIAPCGSVKCIS